MTTHRRGFTLIELLVVIAILGILASIAVPQYLGYIENSKNSEAFSNLQALRVLEEQYFSDNGTYAAGASVNALDDLMPGFQPGSNLHFGYSVVTDTGGYDAKAIKISDSTTFFTIDENNIKGGEIKGDAHSW